MNLSALIGTAMTLIASTSTNAQTLDITRGDSRSVRPGPAEHFTGSVRVQMLFEAADPSHASGGTVAFEPGARTAWHAHPRGQVLIVTGGVGRVQRWGDAVQEMRIGDVVRIPAGEKHWHGASPRVSMTHVAISEHQDGTTVQWMEKVTDEQYNAAPQAQAVAPSQGTTRPSGPLQQRLAPGLARLTDEVLFDDVWRRTDLSPRDRSLVTISVLIATGKSAPLAGHLGRALDNGLCQVARVGSQSFSPHRGPVLTSSACQTPRSSCGCESLKNQALWARVGAAGSGVQGPVGPPDLSADPRGRPRPQAGASSSVATAAPFDRPSCGVAPWLGSCRP